MFCSCKSSSPVEKHFFHGLLLPRSHPHLLIFIYSNRIKIAQHSDRRFWLGSGMQNEGCFVVSNYLRHIKSSSQKTRKVSSRTALQAWIDWILGFSAQKCFGGERSTTRRLLYCVSLSWIHFCFGCFPYINRRSRSMISAVFLLHDKGVSGGVKKSSPLVWLFCADIIAKTFFFLLSCSHFDFPFGKDDAR